ncbi:MAG: hypothetical protein WAM30_14040, partial [Candidatus Dormiibacterota bacterium]
LRGARDVTYERVGSRSVVSRSAPDGERRRDHFAGHLGQFEQLAQLIRPTEWPRLFTWTEPIRIVYGASECVTTIGSRREGRRSAPPWLIDRCDVIADVQTGIIRRLVGTVDEQEILRHEVRIKSVG